MKIIELKSTFTAYDRASDMPAANRSLLQIARQKLTNAYAPYSRFQVSAAVLMSNGAVVSSTNYENAAYPICVCAEHSALIAAANQYPKEHPVKVAITVKAAEQVIDRPALPCGSCRQVICETEIKNKQLIEVSLQGEAGQIFVFASGRDMLPMAFDGSFL